MTGFYFVCIYQYCLCLMILALVHVNNGCSSILRVLLTQFCPSNSTFLVHKSNLYSRMPYRELFGFTHCFVSYISLYVYLCTMDIVHMREEVDIEKGLQTYNLRFSGSNTDCKQLIQLKLILHFHAT